MMAIIDLKTEPSAHWKPTIVEYYAYPPYWWLSGVTFQSRQALLDRELTRAVSDQESWLLGYVSDAGDCLGFAEMRRLEWDTQHFGFDIWRLDHLGAWGGRSQLSHILTTLVQQCLCTAHEQGCHNMQARIPIDSLLSIHALEDFGFKTMEILTTWIFDLSRWPIPPQRNQDLTRNAEPADTASLIELARTVYAPIPDRFHVDPQLSSKASNELYAQWMQNSCCGHLADHISVAESEGQVVGYSTLRYFSDHNGACNARVAQLGLGGVSPEFRQRGIVTDLVIHNLKWLACHQADFCFVGTQGNNVPPQRVWLKIGFKPVTMSLTLHYWA
jgi:GNAT superfamily N-acetyltransferase